MRYSIRAIRPSSVVLPFAVLAFLAGSLTVAALLVSAALAPAPITSSSLSGPLQLAFRGMPPPLLLAAWPFIVAVVSGAIAAVAAWLYNLMVRFTGPVQLELEH
jgi:hypothetical protein